MKHFTTEQWIDFIDEVAASEEKESMAKHLNDGCKSCQKTVSLWQKVQRIAVLEANYDAPKDTVRLVKAAFQTSGLAQQKEGAAEGIKLLFDSFLQPMFEGARSAGAGSRQLLYRAEPFHIDVQIEAKPDGSMLVSGQLLNIFEPEVMACNTQVVLSNMKGQSVQIMANEFGEFTGELANSGDLQMTIGAPGSKPIVISHREALGRGAKEKP